MWKRIASPIPILVVAMTVVAMAFASAIIYFTAATMRVSGETAGMLSNGVPSADQLTRARMSLRHIDGALDRALLDAAESRPFEEERLLQARRELASDIDTYRALPYYRYEDELNRELDHDLARLDEVLSRMGAELSSGHGHAAQELENRDWRQQSDRVDEKLRGLIAFNIRHVTDHALRIDHIRQRAAVIGLLVSGAALALALAATAVAAVAVRRRSRMQEERAAELEMFSSRVAHDLMSPLTSVALALELGRSETRDEHAGRLMERALGSARRMRSIVDGLLDFARSGGRPPAGARCDVAAVVQAVVDETRPAAERARIELVAEPLPPAQVACSAGIVTVLVTNLVNNAIKFMGEAPVRRISVAVDARADRVRIEVADTGPGLPAGFERHAFEPYVRANTTVAGLGLGLATVKRLADAYGGSVGVQRSDATRFWFELPRAA